MRSLFLLLCSLSTLLMYGQNRPANIANSVIYEVNVRQYSEKGDFNAVTRNLRNLKSLGIDILWIMPIHPIGVKNRKGTLGSYYSVRNYRGIDTLYGDTADFRRLVRMAHDMKMKVILDWVANHTAWDHPWIKQHPDWYVQNEKGAIQTQYDWTDVAKLNYKNANMRKAMISEMEYWVKTFGIDGFRCDVAFLVPQDFWEDARTQLEKTKPMYMLAEMEWNNDITATPNTYFDKAFNTSYGWTFMGATQDLAKHKKSLPEFKKEMQENYAKFPPQMSKLFFITNHDENSWNGTIKEKYGRNWKLYATLCYTLPNSMPLMYTGEEAGLNRRLQFFEKDPIRREEWADSGRYNWYRNMISLRHTNRALWNTSTGRPVIEEIQLTQNDTNITNHVYAYRRHADSSEVIVITNFGDADVTFPKQYFHFDEQRMKLLFDHRQFFKNEEGNWTLKGKENVILYK